MGIIMPRGLARSGWVGQDLGVLRVVRRCPALPPGLPGSTLGAGGLSFRVRNGSGRFPAAMAAATVSGCVPSRGVPGRACEPDSGCVGFVVVCLVRCVLVFWVSPRPISTRPLSPLPGVHAGPINPMVCGGPYPINVGGRPHLEAGFPLRCFQRLSLPDVANQPCPWRDNWHTRGPSIPVLSY